MVFNKTDSSGSKSYNNAILNFIKIMLTINHIKSFLFKTKKLSEGFVKIMFYWYLIFIYVRYLPLLVIENFCAELPLKSMSLDPHVNVASLLLPGVLHTHRVCRITAPEVQMMSALCANISFTLLTIFTLAQKNELITLSIKTFGSR